ncbi:MAG TPA: hypothetical protein PLW24_18100, partial [Burkholderiaceae bacterium]|nr:hypothetical protein [Burkholderiaceae bacterium]
MPAPPTLPIQPTATAPGRQPPPPPLWLLLTRAQWRHHPGQTLLALLAIALGVALAFSVHLINASALAEFGQAVRAVNGQPDAVLRPAEGSRLDEAAYPRAALHPSVRLASPVLEIDTQTLVAPPAGASAPPRAGLTRGNKQALRILGIDALRAPAVAPELLPRLREGADRLALLDPDRVFLNPAAQRLWGGLPEQLQVQSGDRLIALAVAGSLAAEGPPLLVMDLAGAQQHFERLGQLSRIDLRLAGGSDATALLEDLNRGQPAQARLRLAPVQEAAQRVSNLSRAYRVNLGVLSLVALFTGAFLVFSVQSLAVAKRIPQLALLGVLGLGARERLRLVQLESLVLGVVGALLGLALGTALALLALQWLGGDLGSGLLGGRIGGGAPPLQWSGAAAAVYGALGVAAAWIGGWAPARQAA